VPGPNKKEFKNVCLTLAQTFLQALQQPGYGGFPLSEKEHQFDWVRIADVVAPPIIWDRLR